MALTSLKVRGPFKGPTGYDHHVREFVRELHRQGVAVQLVDIPEWGPTKLPAQMRDPWFETLDKPVRASIVLHFCMPHQVEPEPKRVNANYTMFEASRIPSSWVAASRKHDLVVLPTESSRRAWVNSGVADTQLRLCPLGINTALFGQRAMPLQLRRETGEPTGQYKVRFLNVSKLGPRKNLLGLLRVWIRATERHDDAVLIVKIGCYAPGWLEQFRYKIHLLQHRLGKRLDEAAPVHLIYDLFSDADMPKLYAAATHYISMSFGEGWDQAMVEAAASGLQLIAPNHSAYTTYLDPSIAHLITSREVPAVFEGGGLIGALFRSANWWEPDEDEAVMAVQLAIAGRDGGKLPARDKILSEFTWEKATRRLIAILDEAVTRNKRRRFWLLPPSYRRA